MPLEKQVFKNFLEFWHFTRSLSQKQRTIIFDSLCEDERKKIEKSFKTGGWEDIMFRDVLDRFADNLKEQFKFDLLEARCKVLKGKSVYVNKYIWDHICSYVKESELKMKHLNYLLGGIKDEPCDANTVLLVQSNKRKHNG